ncbi:MAG: FG-GAP repeat protein [Xanthomonadales bacterium]|nr:FG-GAP repeat protein [Xanthomonadales bacterium]
MNAGIQQLGYLKASNTGSSDWFGISVAISGDTMVVGASLEDSNIIGINNGDGSDNLASNSGAVYVFVRSGNSWQQQAYLKASNTGGGDEFGFSVAISGDTIIVGAPHEDGNGTGVNLGDQDNNEESSSGAVYAFTRTAGIWTQQAYIKASNAEFNDRFGKSVSVSADTMVVGAYLEDSSATTVDGDADDNLADDSGAAYVFTRTGDEWSQSAYLKASNAETTDYFGYAVAISADTIVVGAQNEGSNATQINGDQGNNLASLSGAAYVFIRTVNSWEQQSYLKASNSNSSDRFGFSVAISGETIAVGAHFEDSADTGVNGTGTNNSAFSSGAAYAFNRTNTTWTQQAYLKASNTDNTDLFGFSVAVSGDLLLVGSRLEDSESVGINQDDSNNLADGSGAAYSFIREAGIWQPLAYIKASNTGEGDKFGVAVAASASTLLIGALNEDSNTTEINGDEENDLAPLSGAAYVFSVDNIEQIFIDGFEPN